MSEYEMDEPLGFYVLVEMKKVESTSSGGIILGDVSRDQEAVDVGIVRAIGPVAFHGYPGCIPSEYPPSHPRYTMEPHQIWGINIGDEVGYRRYEGKAGEELYKCIPDSQLIMLKKRKAVQ